MRTLKAPATFLSLTVLFVMLVPLAKADDTDERTEVNFTHSVRIPGMVLAPGTYIFSLLNPYSSRTEVEVINAKTNKVCEIVSGIPDSPSRPVSQAEFILHKGGQPGSPETLTAWFYPGFQNGLEFVYPKQK